MVKKGQLMAPEGVQVMEMFTATLAADSLDREEVNFAVLPESEIRSPP